MAVVTTVSLAQTLFQGSQIGAAVAVDPASKGVAATGLMAPSDASNPANSGTMEIQISMDPQQRDASFVSFASQGWVGGFGKDGVTPNYPSINSPWDGQVPLFVRIRMSMNQLVSAGAQVAVQ